mmetsp:Transcript_4870/g.10686  ORF Transcript_4870/g.10686 Transcript_4870/m.10686 type:complete len:262 (+) Transcript_4870:528-1313(+)
MRPREKQVRAFPPRPPRLSRPTRRIVRIPSIITLRMNSKRHPCIIITGDIILILIILIIIITRTSSIRHIICHILRSIGNNICNTPPRAAARHRGIQRGTMRICHLRVQAILVARLVEVRLHLIRHRHLLLMVCQHRRHHHAAQSTRVQAQAVTPALNSPCPGNIFARHRPSSITTPHRNQAHNLSSPKAPRQSLLRPPYMPVVPLRTTATSVHPLLPHDDPVEEERTASRALAVLVAIAIPVVASFRRVSWPPIVGMIPR